MGSGTADAEARSTETYCPTLNAAMPAKSIQTLSASKVTLEGPNPGTVVPASVAEVIAGMVQFVSEIWKPLKVPSIGVE